MDIIIGSFNATRYVTYKLLHKSIRKVSQTKIDKQYIIIIKEKSIYNYLSL